MPNKTLYIRPHDQRIWDAAAQAAQASRMSLSTLVVTALEQHLKKLSRRVAS